MLTLMDGRISLFVQFVYVKDVARALMTALGLDKEDNEEGTANKDSETPAFRVANVCTGSTITIKEVAELIKLFASSKVHRRRGSPPPPPPPPIQHDPSHLSESRMYSHRLCSSFKFQVLSRCINRKSGEWNMVIN